MTVAVVYGTRPEAIKLYPLVEELRRRKIATKVICTGQHEELLKASSLVADSSLGLMRAGQSPSEFLARALETLRFDATTKWVVVQGDTVSAFAGALAAFHAKVPVAHVEAGLRTGLLGSPFPEEGYRLLVDSIALRHYAPTNRALECLHQEGKLDAVLTGNTGIDAAFLAMKNASSDTPVRSKNPYMLVTLHRRESFGDPMRAVCRGVLKVVRMAGLDVIWPVHPNPEVSSIVHEEVKEEPRVKLVPPMNHPELLAAIRDAEFVLTDSGGIQEEAPMFGVPVLIAREATERPESVDAGAAVLVGTDEYRVFQAVMGRTWEREPKMLYGDGHASERIVDDLQEFM
jgi:UDP-N-acetylglucosamine 2-epimerase (non-hydrolysing)